MKDILLKTGKFAWKAVKEIARGIVTVMSLVEVFIQGKGGKE